MFTYASFLSTISIVILRASSCAIDGNDDFNDGNKRTESDMAWYGNNKHIGEGGNNTHYNDNKNIHKDGINKYNSYHKNVNSSSKQVVDKNKTKRDNNKHIYGNRKSKNGIKKREHSNKILGERNNNEDDNKKLDNGNKEHEDSQYGNKNGNYRRGRIPPDPPDPASIDRTESWAELINKLTTPTTRKGDNNKFHVPEENVTALRRTTPYRVSLEEECDYLAYYCMKAYKTSKICARTLYYNYQSFNNYCMMDYVNCMERYEVWQITHMGECFDIKRLIDYQHYEYQDDAFLDQVYVIQE